MPVLRQRSFQFGNELMLSGSPGSYLFLNQKFTRVGLETPVDRGADAGMVNTCLQAGHAARLPTRLSGTLRPFWHFGHLILIGITTRPCAWSWGGVVKENCTAQARRRATVQ